MTYAPSPSSNRSRAAINIRRELFNALLSVVVIVLLSWALWYYFDLSLDSVKGLFIVATGGVVGTGFGFLGEETRRSFLEKIRSFFLSKNYTRFLLATSFSIVVTSLLLTRVEVTWKTGKPNINQNGTSILIGEEDRSINIWGFPFVSHKISVGERSIDYMTFPIIPRKIELSEGDVYAGEAEYISISELLRLSFFQYVENRFLLAAKSAFSSDRAKKYIALDAIHSILEICFVKDDISRSGSHLFEKFKVSYPNSSWVGLADACLMYGKRDYSGATRALEAQSRVFSGHTKATYEFFNGVNKLKHVVRALKPGNSLGSDAIQPAIINFQNAELILRDGPDSFFKEIALPSSQILQGISLFYSKDIISAAAKFQLASSSSYPGLKARALNALGFIKLVEGDVAAGKDYFTRSLSADNSFPYARTNLAYCYMAEGKYEQAQKEFSEIIKDENIRRESMRDVILAQVGSAHVLTIGKSDEETVQEYSNVMKSINMFDYSSVEQPSLRLFYIYKTLADKLYGDNRYYGLEIFSLAMYSLAYKKIIAFEKNNPSEMVAKLKLEVLTSAMDVKQNLQPTWFVFKEPKGFFAPTYDMSQEIDSREK